MLDRINTFRWQSITETLLNALKRFPVAATATIGLCISLLLLVNLPYEQVKGSILYEPSYWYVWVGALPLAASIALCFEKGSEPHYTTFGIPTRCTIMELVRLHFERYSRTFLRGTCFHSSYRNIFFVLILGCLFEKGHRYLFLEFLLSVVYSNTNRLTFCIGLGSRPLSGVIFYRYSVRL